MQQTINNELLKDMIEGACQYLQVNKDYVDDLNVFPVPDGDTGTNMSMTMTSVHNEMQQLPSEDMMTVATSIARGALKGARGNSGVILSQILKGMTNKFKQVKTIDAKLFAEAMKEGTEIAYSAVTKPKEGTILTVIRVMSEQAKVIAKRKNISIEEFLKCVLVEGEKILAATPDMLPVLKKAGVVDAGGRGLLCIFYGFYNIIAGIPLPVGPIEDASASTTFESLAQNANEEIYETGDITFAYCTEFFIIDLFPKVTESDIDKLRDLYMTIGDCVLVIGDLAMVKVHLHTNRPDKALKAALCLGSLDKLKIENMIQQNIELQAKRKSKEIEIKPRTDRAMVAICAGDGVANIFRDFGVEYIVQGGQTMNPSVEDILKAINEVNADEVIILPNNTNIILAAEQARELAECKVYVIPTTNIPEGIAAALLYNTDRVVRDIAEDMIVDISKISSGQITYAVRNTKMDGFSLKKGDIIGLTGKKIVAKGNSLKKVVEATIEKMMTEDFETITLYYGNDTTEEEANIIVDKLAEKYKDLEVFAYYGGQPHYYYLISLE